MKLKDVFDQLTAGEFSQLNIGGAKLGEIQEKDWATVASHITLGLTALHRRFNLRQGRISLALTADKEFYPLDSKYAVANTRSKEPADNRFILDSIANPFRDDLLKIERVLLNGSEVALNDPLAVESVIEPRAGLLQVPPDWEGTLQVRYRANHPPLVLKGGYLDPGLVEIELPDAYLQALLYFVASRAHNPVGMVNEFNAGNNWAAKFERECKQLEADNLAPAAGSDIRGQTRFERGGWV